MCADPFDYTGKNVIMIKKEEEAIREETFASNYTTRYRRTHDWLHTVWEQGKNFDDGADNNHWFDGKSLVGVLCLMHK